MPLEKANMENVCRIVRPNIIIQYANATYVHHFMQIILLQYKYTYELLKFEYKTWWWNDERNMVTIRANAVNWMPHFAYLFIFFSFGEVLELCRKICHIHWIVDSGTRDIYFVFVWTNEKKFCGDFFLFYCIILFWLVRDMGIIWTPVTSCLSKIATKY